jgi:hypothetical protein
MLPMIFIYSAVLGGVFFAIQLVMMLMSGGDDGHDPGEIDPGVDDSGLQGESGGSLFYELFSLRTIAAAVTFFGLVGMAMLKSGSSETTATTVGVIAGLASLYGVYWIYKQIYRLQSSGTQDIHNSVGLTATVYIPIPAGNTGRGKIQFAMQGRIVEYLALTDEEEKLTTGESVLVTDIVDSETVRVMRSE